MLVRTKSAVRPRGRRVHANLFSRSRGTSNGGRGGVDSDAAADDLGVKLSWGAPLDTGGALLTGYQVTVTAADGSAAVGVTGPTIRTVAGLSTVFTGLTNGLDYRFEVRAVNGLGDGAAASVTITH